jgi:hypothetical protein
MFNVYGPQRDALSLGGNFNASVFLLRIPKIVGSVYRQVNVVHAMRTHGPEMKFDRVPGHSRFLGNGFEIPVKPPIDLGIRM